MTSFTGKQCKTELIKKLKLKVPTDEGDYTVSEENLIIKFNKKEIDYDKKLKVCDESSDDDSDEYISGSDSDAEE